MCAYVFVKCLMERERIKSEGVRKRIERLDYHSFTLLAHSLIHCTHFMNLFREKIDLLREKNNKIKELETELLLAARYTLQLFPSHHVTYIMIVLIECCARMKENRSFRGKKVDL